MFWTKAKPVLAFIYLVLIILVSLFLLMGQGAIIKALVK